uniref:Uncharacterized protein n=1 Tax=Sphaerodactylus townsendi TaxID=933632 RepID=A0ACB8ET52_9SAUR
MTEEPQFLCLAVSVACGGGSCFGADSSSPPADASPSCPAELQRSCLQGRPAMSDPAQQPAPGAGEGGEGAGGPPGAPPNLTSNRRLQQTQAQVEEVVDIMRVNVDKVLERDQKLSELDERADALQAGAQVFESSAAALKRKYWWKNCKMMIMLGVICAIVVIAIAREGGGWRRPGDEAINVFGQISVELCRQTYRSHREAGFGFRGSTVKYNRLSLG